MTSSPPSLILKLYEERQLLLERSLTRPIEFGRQNRGEPSTDDSLQFLEQPNCDRLVIAGMHETTIPRRYLRLEPQADGMVRVINLSPKMPLLMGLAGALPPTASGLFGAPLEIHLGGRLLRVEASKDDEIPLASLARPAPRPDQRMAPTGDNSLRSVLQSVGTKIVGDSFSGAGVIQFLQEATELFRSAANSLEFLKQAALSAQRLVDLDVAAVLNYDQGCWLPSAIQTRGHDTPALLWQPSTTVLRRVLTEKSTCRSLPVQNTGAAPSLAGVHSLVAAPILDSIGNVVGALYGERRQRGILAANAQITEMEAALLELLALGVGSGWARIEQERQAASNRVRFEQFFTPKLAKLLEQYGDAMLAPRKAAITVLFCDIKGFSRISNEQGAEAAIEWLRDVLNMLSDAVDDHDGALIDFSGDALEAIWGAPDVTTKHAARACRAAHQMRMGLAALNQRWEARIRTKTDVSIGINSGDAQVGNIGSRRKFKYGAFGTTVNQASRVQGATKLIGLPMLVTRSTADQLGDEFPLRRLCTVRTVNISDPVELFELAEFPHASWRRLQVEYESALVHFERAELDDALEILGRLGKEFSHDQPRLNLVRRVAEAQNYSEGVPFSAVWTLGSK